MNELHYFLGMKVIWTPNGILLTQRHYILNILFKFDMAKCKPISTPLDCNLKFHEDSDNVCEPTQYLQIIRSLIYNYHPTQPELSRQTSKPIHANTKQHSLERCKTGIKICHWHPRSRTLLQEEWTDLTQRVYRCGLDQKCYGSQNDLCIEEQYHYIWEQIAARDIADCSRRHWSPTCQHRRADRRRFHQGTWSWQAAAVLDEPVGVKALFIKAKSHLSSLFLGLVQCELGQT